MAKAYQFDASGYFVGEVEDYGLLPNNATYTAPKSKDGFIACWTGSTWKLIENHKGKEGYLNGEPHTIKEYGPLPDGWSDTPPEPTEIEQALSRMVEIDSEIQLLEQKTIRPTLAIELGIDEEFDHERRKEIVTQIIDLRCERQRLEVIIDPELII